MSYVLGIDTSTTATKALLVDGEGRVAGVAASEYGYETPHPLWSEQDPELWWRAVRASVSAVLAESGASGSEVAAVGLTGQMHGLTLLDHRGRVLRPAILWNDQRTAEECEQMRTALGAARLIEITGNDALPGFTAPKILWVRNEEPDVYRAASHALLPKDYVRLQLTGDYATDKAGGSGTQLFDLAARDWSGEVLEALEIDPGLLPESHEGPAVTGQVSGPAAVATGLGEGIPVVAGAGDQAAAAVGLGVISPGLVALSLGTSGVVFTSTAGPSYEPEGRLHAFCHGVPGMWHLMGVMLSAAGSLRWFRDALSPGADFGELAAAAADVPAGADGLLFLPYLSGERTPHPDPLARGAFVGLTTRHRREHLTRALLEGVAFGLRDALELMRATGMEHPDQIRATGGGVQSSFWRQVIADVLDTEVVLTGNTEGAAYGAAILASVGAGWHDDVAAACDAWVELGASSGPGESKAVYDEMYSQYGNLYPALHDTLHSLGAVEGDSP